MIDFYIVFFFYIIPIKLFCIRFISSIHNFLNNPSVVYVRVVCVTLRYVHVVYNYKGEQVQIIYSYNKLLYLSHTHVRSRYEMAWIIQMIKLMSGGWRLETNTHICYNLSALRNVQFLLKGC